MGMVNDWGFVPVEVELNCGYNRKYFINLLIAHSCLCVLVVTVPGYRFLLLPHFLRSSLSGTGYTQPREDK
jgi:hypothetical protein